MARSGKIVAFENEPEVRSLLETFLGWTQGRFQFAPGEGGEGAPLGESFGGG